MTDGEQYIIEDFVRQFQKIISRLVLMSKNVATVSITVKCDFGCDFDTGGFSTKNLTDLELLVLLENENEIPCLEHSACFHINDQFSGKIGFQPTKLNLLDNWQY